MAFKDFAGQEQGVELLQRSLERGRLGHGYLFTGTKRHFVQYRDAAAPFGYDVREIAPTARAGEEPPPNCLEYGHLGDPWRQGSPKCPPRGQIIDPSPSVARPHRPSADRPP